MTEQDHLILMTVRRALLLLVDAVEMKLEIPRTKELRERVKKLEYEHSIAQPLKTVIMQETK